MAEELIASNIKDEVDNDPSVLGLGLFFIGNNDAEIRRELNLIRDGSVGVYPNAQSKTIQIVVPVPMLTLRLFLLNNSNDEATPVNLRKALVTDRDTPASTTMQLSDTLLYDYLNTTAGEFYLDEATITGFLDSFVANSVISAQNKTDFLAMVKRDASRSEERWGYGIDVSSSMIAEARKLA